MVLQAYIDDITQAGEVTVLAGYVSSSQDWAKFSIEWQQLLSIRPPQKRFKMSEFMQGGGDESLERAGWHYRLIEKYTNIRFCVAVPHKPLRKVLQYYLQPQNGSDPYYMGMISLLSVIQTYVHPQPMQQIDVIFDYQSEANKVLLAWDTLVRSGSVNTKLFSNHPIFRKDEDFLPLQAADLFAWHMRKRYRETGTVLNSAHPFMWPEGSGGPRYIYSELDEAGIRKHFESIAKSLPGVMSFGRPAMVAGRTFF